jgi:phosphoribosylanthranilate isomerase
MNAVEVKICGVRTVEAVAASLDHGAAWLGFNFFPKSPRFLSLEAARPLREMARGRARAVALLVDPDDALVADALRLFSPDHLQLHGSETPARVAAIARQARAAGAGIIKAFGVATPRDVAAAADWAEVADLFLFDAKPPPGAAMPGGHGLTHDWNVLRDAAITRPWMLAGGLSPGNVAEAIAASGARIVDVSSGVESAPGLKDPTLIAAFLAAARASTPASP